MSENQEQLSKSLLTSYSTTLNAIKGNDLKIIVYEDPAWQLRDVLWHIAVWDRQVTKSIQAFTDGREYSIPNFDEDNFNGEAFIEGKKQLRHKYSMNTTRRDEDSGMQSWTYRLKNTHPTFFIHGAMRVETSLPWSRTCSNTIRNI